MINQDFTNIYLSKLKFIIQGIEHHGVYDRLLISFEEKFDLFNKNEVSFASFWYETLLDRFISIIENKHLALEIRLGKILDLMVDLEIKSKEIRNDINNIFHKIDYNKYGIA